jgi:cadmium resistance protein CadD (predicted permease)
VPHTEITSVAAIVASVTTFAATNVDDLFLLSVFFARREPMRRVMAGQYLGFAGIVVLSMFGFWAALAQFRGSRKHIPPHGLGWAANDLR